MDDPRRAAEGRQDRAAGMGCTRAASRFPSTRSPGRDGPPHDAGVHRDRQRRRGAGERHRRQQARRRATGRGGVAADARRMTTRCGFAAIVGAPNAGKSTLLNRLTGAKLSIVSPKAQTTRLRVLGILMRGETQILLVDTPGIFKPRRKLDRAMVAAAWTGAKDADLVLLLVDAKAGITPQVRADRRAPGRAGRRGMAGAEQDRPGLPGAAAAADGRAERHEFVRRDLHGLRRQWRRRGGVPGGDRGGDAGGAVPLSARGRPDRFARPAAGGRDRARADLPADARGGTRTPPPSRPRASRSAATARCASTRRSTSRAPGTRRS